ncbi:glycosyltransferase family A protein [Roseimicrobium sp. ORNL1]|uniref:glycosyltransferase family 2 protein n=1 Tax=Roseimicrobium sp. ORNL1 TaxID=2711231 RepID=UPI0013E2009C|nr:glycosyltransferase family A protein [Roseimicrobium sp. ORNL1]QIF03681.1 glycosyltransferase family 2 protein [Roseimicrobium sp. ORNL1]
MERFTIVIPTLNRCETLAHTLETCIAQEDENFEILVSDNLSTDATAEVLESFRSRDPRLRTVQPPQRQGMADHWEFALSKVERGFFMILGSDDGLLPGAVSTARRHLSESPGAKALHAGLQAMYFYPGAYSEWSDCLQLHLTRTPDTRGVRERLKKAAAADEHYALPFCYNFGWVRTSVLDDLVSRTGRRISSLFPDSYLAIATACLIKDEEMISIPPVGVLGFSGKSTGCSFAKRDASPDIQAAFNEGNTIALHPKIRYTEALDFHFGDAFLRAEELGLLPSGITIHWEKRVARACADFHKTPWQEDESAAKWRALHEQAALVGCSHVLEGAGAPDFPDISTWISQLPYGLESDDPPFELSLDTAPLHLRGIHDAVKLASGLLEAGRKGAAPLIFAEASPADLQNWTMMNLVQERRETHEKWLAAGKELRRQLTQQEAARAELEAEREKLQVIKAKLAETKTKLNATKQALARFKSAPAPSRTKSWLPKWFGS